jgi:hypothetical protein
MSKKIWVNGHHIASEYAGRLLEVKLCNPCLIRKYGKVVKGRFLWNKYGLGVFYRLGNKSDYAFTLNQGNIEAWRLIEGSLPTDDEGGVIMSETDKTLIELEEDIVHIKRTIESLTSKIDVMSMQLIELINEKRFHARPLNREPGWRCKYPPNVPIHDVMPYYYDDGVIRKFVTTTDGSTPPGIVW